MNKRQKSTQTTIKPDESVSLSRRKLLGKLAYAAPTLSLLTLNTNNVNAISLPPCAPNESPPGCTAVNSATTVPTSRRPSRRPSGPKPPGG